MSGRRAQSLPVMETQKPARGRCVSAICFSWKVLTCIVSHVTLVLLVVSYCVGGAYLFQHLEKPHEIEVKKGIQNMRYNLTDRIWKFSDNSSVLSENVWIANVKKDLANFEKQILTAIKTDGWDGDEDITKSQWTFAGSLFYSIIVITTIGYGHISPRTDWGKVTTIFYAIVGIPLMLLCLSNIGDVMATSFRFIYWRICCYVCTRTSRRPRNRSRHRSVRSHRYSSRSQPPPFRRSMKLTQRSANDSGMGNSIGLPHAYSDPELRTTGHNDYNYDFEYGRGGSQRIGGSVRRGNHGRLSPQQQQRHVGRQPHHHHHGMPPYEDEDQFNEDTMQPYGQTLNRPARFSSRQRQRDRMRDYHTVERERYLSRSKQQFESNEDLPGPTKRAMSVRSVRSPNLRRDEVAHASNDARASRELNRLHSHTMPRGRSVPSTPRGRAKSVDPRAQSHYEDVNEELVRKTPIISNRYAIDDMEYTTNTRQKYSARSQSMPRSAHQRQHLSNHHETPQRYHSPHAHPPHHPAQFQRRSSLGRQPSRFGNRLELPELHTMPTIKRGRSPRYDDYEDDFDECYMEEQPPEVDDYAPHHNRQREQRKRRPERLPPSPRIMSPMGFAVKRQIRRRPSFDCEDDSLYGDEWSGDYYGDMSPKDRPVPIWLCVFLVISYILGGAALFAYWEEWSFLDSAYFCFITLTTIGFGDFVPAKGVKDESEQSIAYCSLYLLFGIALLAMSFNLVQEEFIANVKEVARRLGILKDDEEDELD